MSLFSAKNKPSQICPTIERCVRKKLKSQSCTVKYGKQFVSCTVGAVYKIPFSCGWVYIGQRGRCVNIPLREHQSLLKGCAYSHLSMHCRDCKCEPRLSDTEVLFKHRDQVSREIVVIPNKKDRSPLCQLTVFGTAEQSGGVFGFGLASYHFLSRLTLAITLL